MTKGAVTDSNLWPVSVSHGSIPRGERLRERMEGRSAACVGWRRVARALTETLWEKLLFFIPAPVQGLCGGVQQLAPPTQARCSLTRRISKGRSFESFSSVGLTSDAWCDTVARSEQEITAQMLRVFLLCGFYLKRLMCDTVAGSEQEIAAQTLWVFLLIESTLRSLLRHCC